MELTALASEIFKQFPRLSALLAFGALVKWLDESSHFRLLYASVTLRGMALSDKSLADSKPPLVMNKSLQTVLQSYIVNQQGTSTDGNGFVVVIKSAMGTGKSTCLDALACGQLGFLPDRVIRVDLKGSDGGTVGARLKNAFGCTPLETPNQVVKVLLPAAAGVMTENYTEDGIIKAVRERMSSLQKMKMSVGSFVRSTVNTFMNIGQCGRDLDTVNDSQVAYPGSADTLPSDVKEISTDPTSSSVLSSEQKEQERDDSPVEQTSSHRKYPILYQQGESAETLVNSILKNFVNSILGESERHFVGSHGVDTVSKGMPAGLICIDNVGPLDNDQDATDFFEALHEQIWKYERRVVAFVTTKHDSVAEVLRKMNGNQKIFVAEGLYSGDPKGEVQLEYNDFGWTTDDKVQHLLLKYSEELNSDKFNSNELKAVISEAAKEDNIRDAQSLVAGFKSRVEQQPTGTLA